MSCRLHETRGGAAPAACPSCGDPAGPCAIGCGDRDCEQRDCESHDACATPMDMHAPRDPYERATPQDDNPGVTIEGHGGGLAIAAIFAVVLLLIGALIGRSLP